MNKLLNIVILASHFLLLSCATKDLRGPKFIATGITKESTQKANEILDKVIKHYGTRENWLSFTSAQITYEDHWDAFFPRIYNSPYEDDMPIKYEMLLRTFNSKISFLEGDKKGDVWGLQQWATYAKKYNSKFIFKKHFKTKFHLAARQFFFELPFNLKGFEIRSYLGDEKINNNHYHKIYFSNTFEISKTEDQFIAYINSKTYDLELIYYTIREMSTLFSGANHFSNFKNIQGIRVPMKSIVRWVPFGEKIVHQFKVNQIKFLKKSETDIKSFIPKPEIRGNYYDYF